MNGKVLIVCYSFPPCPEIGGRRWSFFGQYLQEEGVEVFVLASDYMLSNKGDSPWEKCIKGYEKNIIYIPNKIPYHIMEKSPKNIFSKLKYKLSEKKALRDSGQNPYDRSIYFGKSALLEAKRIIESNNISTVIISGGPYDFLADLADLKNIFKSKVKLIVDFRDPWTEKYSNEELQKSYRLSEQKKNKYVLEEADLVYVPTLGMYNLICERWGEYKDKIKLIPHGYDNEVFDNWIVKKGRFGEWFYAGTLYPLMNLEVKIMQQLLSFTSSSLDIYSFHRKNDYNLYDNDYIHFKGVLPQKELLKKTEKRGVSLILSPDFQKNNRTSKFYELVKAGKFLLYIGPKGITSEFIENEKLGFVIDSNLIKEVNEKLVKDLLNAFEQFEIAKQSLISSYSMKSITSQIIEDLA